MKNKINIIEGQTSKEKTSDKGQNIQRQSSEKQKSSRQNKERNSEKKGETHPMVKQTEIQTKSATKNQQNGAK